MGKPRASGDDPHQRFHSGFFAGVNPARAGMIPPPSSRDHAATGKPRASGDDPNPGTKSVPGLL